MRMWNHRSRSVARLTSGDRIYAIGDIHGEAALFEKLLGQIVADSRERGPARTTLILLGDVIDRGNAAAGLLRMLAPLEDERLVILKGNHESAFVDCYRGDEEALGFWKAFGGRATMVSFGIPEEDVDAPDPRHLLTLLRTHVEPTLIDWLDDLPTFWSSGGYAFVHAGVRPGIRFEQQDESDLIWIREPFLSSRKNHGKVVVHGHTVAPGIPRLGGNRIGVDTGAHEYGTLTALGLEGDEQWILQTVGGAPDASRPTRRSDEQTTPEAATAFADHLGRFGRIERLIASIIGEHRPDSSDPLLLSADSIVGTISDKRPRFGSRSWPPALAAILLGLSAFVMSPYCAARLGPQRANTPLLTLALSSLVATPPPPAVRQSPAADIGSTGERGPHKLRRRRVANAPTERAEAAALVPEQDAAASPTNDAAAGTPTRADQPVEDAKAQPQTTDLASELAADRLATARLNSAEIARLHAKR